MGRCRVRSRCTSSVVRRSIIPFYFTFSLPLSLLISLSLSVCCPSLSPSLSFSFCLSHSSRPSATFLFRNDRVTCDTRRIVLNIAKRSREHVQISRIRSEDPRPPRSLLTFCLVVFDIKKFIANSWGEFLRTRSHGIRAAFICTATARRVVRRSAQRADHE